MEMQALQRVPQGCCRPVLVFLECYQIWKMRVSEWDVIAME